MLGILGATWGSIGRLRASFYRRGWLHSSRLHRPVVSVGGLSVGGAGKTPATALVAALLRDAGYRPAILSRGYRRSGREPLLVSAGDGPLLDAARAGDEPYWLASVLPDVAVAVATLRRDAARVVAACGDCDVFVLDDGFQHLQLQRDADLLMVNPEAPFWDDRPMPGGRLREHPAAAARADAYLRVDGSDDAAPCPQLANRPCFALRRQAVVGWPAGAAFPPATTTGAAAPAWRPPAGAAYAFAGIARPARFFDDVAAHGIDLRGVQTFADHHRFDGNELEAVAAAARDAGAAALLTTEKDAVRLPGRLPDMPIWVWGYRLEAIDPQAFIDWLRTQANLDHLPDAA